MSSKKATIAVIGAVVLLVLSLTSACQFSAAYDGKYKGGVCVPDKRLKECCVTVGVTTGAPAPGIN